MDTLTTIEILRSIASDILLFGGALAILIFLVLLVVILRGVFKTMKMVNNLNEAFLQLRTGLEKLIDPLAMFANMLRMSVQKTKKPAKKPAKKTVKKPVKKAGKKPAASAAGTKKKSVKKTTK